MAPLDQHKDGQRNDSRLQAANYGDFYMEKLLQYMEDHVQDDPNEMPEWQGSKAYTDRFKIYLWKAEHLSEYIPSIQESYRILYQIRPAVKWVQDRDITPLLQGYADTLSAAVAQNLSNGFTPDQINLLDKIRPYLACQSFLEAIPFNRIQYAQGGIYFRTYDGPSSRQLQTATDGAIKALKAAIEEKAKGAWTALLRFLDDNAGDYPGYEKQDFYYPDQKTGYQQTLIRTRNGIVL